jgi:hypothetical protein
VKKSISVEIFWKEAEASHGLDNDYFHKATGLRSGRFQNAIANQLFKIATTKVLGGTRAVRAIARQAERVDQAIDRDLRYKS